MAFQRKLKKDTSKEGWCKQEVGTRKVFEDLKIFEKVIKRLLTLPYR